VCVHSADPARVAAAGPMGGEMAGVKVLGTNAESGAAEARREFSELVEGVVRAVEREANAVEDGIVDA
jgi:hypothetical protein